MKKPSRSIGAFLALWIAGCVGAPIDAPTVAANTTTTANPHTGLAETVGPVAYLNGNIMEGFYMLRSFHSKDSAAPFHQLYFTVSSRQWLFLRSAHSQGRALPFRQISRKVGYCGRYGCTVHEDVGINLSIEEIRTYSQTGLALQLSGQRGSRVYNIPASYFAGYSRKIAA